MHFLSNIIFSQFNQQIRTSSKENTNLVVIILLLHLAAEFPTETTTDVLTVWLTARLIRAWGLRIFESFFQEYIKEILIILIN